MLLAALLLIWPLTETHAAPESSCLLVRQGQRVYLAMTVEVSRLTGSATITLPGPDVPVGAVPRVTAEQQAKLEACMAEHAAKAAADDSAQRSWQDCRAQPPDCSRLSGDAYLRCLSAGPACGPEPERIGNRYGYLLCEATAGITLPSTKRSPGRVIELARYDSISNDVSCICKWDHCVVR